MLIVSLKRVLGLNDQALGKQTSLHGVLRKLFPSTRDELWYGQFWQIAEVCHGDEANQMKEINWID